MKNLMVFVIAGFLFYGCIVTELVEPRSILKSTEQSTEISTTPVYYYSQFGAKGDGLTDDFDAIRMTHDTANRVGAKVRGDPGATYYIGATNKSAIVQTDTDWGDSKFIIDDTTIEKRGNAWNQSWLFSVESAQKPYPIYSISGLKKFQDKVSLNLGKKAMLIAIDNTTRRYIRSGGNANAGAFQRDVFIVDKDGNVDQRAPIIWDFNNITSLMVYPIDDHQLKITGGHFTTIAHMGAKENDPAYIHGRGIQVLRSNVLIDGLYHVVVGEVWPMVAYYGFVLFRNCADSTIQNSTLSGRLYSSRDGTYDLIVETSVNLSIINVKQTNDIRDSAYWGIFAANYSKNILFDGVSLSRFDAHTGVYNATIRNSQIGHMGIQIIGGGTLRIENTTTWNAGNFISLRNDYGSNWDGNIYIKNARQVLSNNQTGATIVSTNNNGSHDFGYPCSMPKYIYIDGYHIENVRTVTPNLATITTPVTGTNLKSPYTLSEKIYIKRYTTDNNRPYSVSSYLSGKVIEGNWDWPLED